MLHKLRNYYFFFRVKDFFSGYFFQRLGMRFYVMIFYFDFYRNTVLQRSNDKFDLVIIIRLVAKYILFIVKFLLM